MLRKTQNQLLQRDDVGKAKPSVRDLPVPEFTYGQPCPKEPEGVAGVVTKWKLHNQSRKGLPDKDFKTLNKLSVYNKATTCQTMYSFRQNVDVRLKQPLQQKGIVLPDEEFTYGKSNRPSTPIKAVVGGFYGDIAEHQTLQRYEILKAQSKPVTLVDARNHTKASQMAQEHVKSSARLEEMRQSQTLFKMTKFKNVQPRTNTYNGMRRVASQAVFQNKQ